MILILLRRCDGVCARERKALIPSMTGGGHKRSCMRERERNSERQHAVIGLRTLLTRDMRWNTSEEESVEADTNNKKDGDDESM